MLDRRRRRHRLVGRRLQREHLAAPVAAVGGDQHLGLGVVDAVGERLRREAAEHDAVGGADAGAGQHRHRRLGDHRQVDVDPVAGLHAEALQGVGEALHLVEQLGVRDRPGVARLALEVDGDLVAAPGGDVAVEAVVGDVELAADEPLGVRQLPLADRVPVLRPVEQLGRLAGPEALVVLGRLVVHPRADDERVALDVLGRRERAVLGRAARRWCRCRRPVLRSCAATLVSRPDGPDSDRRRGRAGSQGARSWTRSGSGSKSKEASDVAAVAGGRLDVLADVGDGQRDLALRADRVGVEHVGLEVAARARGDADGADRRRRRC